MPPFDPAQGDSPPANQRDPTSRIGGRQADGKGTLLSFPHGKESTKESMPLLNAA